MYCIYMVFFMNFNLCYIFYIDSFNLFYLRVYVIKYIVLFIDCKEIKKKFI